MIKVVENVIEKQYQDELENVFLSADFSWFLNRKTATPGSDRTWFDAPSVFDSLQFTHTIVRDGSISSNIFNTLTKLCNNIAIKESIHTFNMHRVKANLTMPQQDFKKGMYKPPHTDTHESNCITAIYYVNDSDGDTLFFDSHEKMQENNDFTILKTVSPKKGSLVYFPSNIVHSSEYPVNSLMRCVINFNFLQK